MKRSPTSESLPLRPSELSLSSVAGDRTVVPFAPTDDTFDSLQSSVLPSSEAPLSGDKKTLGSKSLHRGIKGIRQSLRIKKKPKNGLEESPNSSSVSINAPPGNETTVETPKLFAEGIRSEDVSTPINTPAKPSHPPQTRLTQKKSLSPFQRFGSLRRTESPMLRFGRRGGSLRSKTATEKSETSFEPPKIVKKEELITQSKPKFERSVDILNASNPFESSAEEFDVSNPFCSKQEISDFDDSNPFRTVHPVSSEQHSSEVSLQPKEGKQKSKSFRKSIRKSFGRFGSIRKGKKVSSEVSGSGVETIAMNATNPPPAEAQPLLLKPPLPEKQKNQFAVREDTLDSSQTPDKPPKLPEKKKSKLESPPKTKVVTDELAYKMIQLQVRL